MRDKLSTNEWSIIITIKQEPHYKFVGNEGKIAERMTRKGLIVRRHGVKGEYYVSDKGWKLYNRDLK